MQAGRRNYKVLRGLLAVIAILATVGGLFLIFGTSWIVQKFMPGLSDQATALMLLLLKDFGAFAFMVAYLFFMTSRDPVRYVAVINGFALVAFLLAIFDVYGIVALHFGAYYPLWAIWARIVLRVALGSVLLAMRPKEVSV
jgi:hypothetical protein